MGMLWQKLRKDRSLPQLSLMLALSGAFAVVMLLPLYSLFSKAFLDSAGNFVGLENYRQYFSSPALSVSVGNTVFVSALSTLVSTTLGFSYAYALTRTHLPCKTFFRYAALLPIFLPTVVHGLALVYLFGRQGLFTTALGVEVALYGRLGIVLSEIIYTFPQAYLMFYVALGYCDGRLYEAAQSMGMGPVKQFFTITLPGVRYTLISCLFVCFTLAFTDFGAPKVLGGSYNVLATDIYKQVAGQFNMNMGAVVGTLLLLPAVLNFAVDRITSRQDTGISAKAQALAIKPNRPRDLFFLVLCGGVVLCFLTLVGVLVMGAFVTYYPYDMTLTLKNFRFNPSTGGIGSFFNSVWMSLLSALCGTAFVFLYAYLVEKGKGMAGCKRVGRFLSTLPIALPGMVIGLAFIFFFNNRSNPFHFLYGTVAILVLANVLHFYSVPFVTASGALKKLDKEYENVAQCMRLPVWKLFFRVTVPMSLPAVLEIFLYYFVNSMVTVSAVVFLYSANFKVASIAITHMEEAGDFSQAAAMSLLILCINLAVRIGYEIVVRLPGRAARAENPISPASVAGIIPTGAAAAERKESSS